MSRAKVLLLIFLTWAWLLATVYACHRLCPLPDVIQSFALFMINIMLPIALFTAIHEMRNGK